MREHDYRTVTELLAALDYGWSGLRSAPADGHPEITIAAGSRVQIHTPVDAHTSSVDTGPVVRAYTDGYELMATVEWAEDPQQAVEEVVARVVAAQDRVRPGVLGDLHVSAAALREAEARVDDARAARDEAVRAALAAEVSVADIVARTGISRERVYQIRDGRR